MSDDKQVNQPQNDVQVAEVKETKTDETKPSTTFNQEDVDRIVKQRLEAEKLETVEPDNNVLETVVL